MTEVVLSLQTVQCQHRSNTAATLMAEDTLLTFSWRLGQLNALQAAAVPAHPQIQDQAHC